MPQELHTVFPVDHNGQMYQGKLLNQYSSAGRVIKGACNVFNILQSGLIDVAQLNDLTIFNTKRSICNRK